jgi:L-lactate dehydrogenase complex protein LldE
MLTPPNRPATRQVQLMITCLCDLFFDDVARAAVEVLESLGCEVEFPEQQTCCGQPAFNAGDWPASRKAVRQAVAAFRGDKPVIVPSASCAAMLFHGAPLAFEHEPDHEEVLQLAGRTWELADFIVHGLGVSSWPGRWPDKVAFHPSCHSRGTASSQAAELLLTSIAGLELVRFGEPEQCCGFGGVFSVGFPHISARMGELKLKYVREAQADCLVSADMGCLMHLGGLLDKERATLPRYHLAQVLRDALGNGA